MLSDDTRTVEQAGGGLLAQISNEFVTERPHCEIDDDSGATTAPDAQPQTTP